MKKKRKVDKLFESRNKVHASGQQQVDLVCEHSMDDLLNYVIRIQDGQQPWPPDKEKINEKIKIHLTVINT